MGSDLIVTLFMLWFVAFVFLIWVGGVCVCVWGGGGGIFVGEVFLLYAFCDVGLRRSELLCISVSPL